MDWDHIAAVLGEEIDVRIEGANKDKFVIEWRGILLHHLTAFMRTTVDGATDIAAEITLQIARDMAQRLDQRVHSVTKSERLTRTVWRWTTEVSNHWPAFCRAMKIE